MVLKVELPRRAVVERTMGLFAVVLPTPIIKNTPNIVWRPEPAHVQALVTQPAVEAFDMAVLHGMAGLDVDQPDLPIRLDCAMTQCR